MEAAELVKMVRLAEQCLERVKSCLERRKGPPGDERPPTTAPGDERPPTTAPALAPPRSTAACPNSKWSRAVQPRHSRVSEAVEAPAAFLPPEVFQKIQAAESQDSRKELTPIQEASRLNQKLKANYEARLSRLSPSQASQKTSLTLSLQRQMTENIIIARAREQAICIIFGLQEVFIFCYRDALRSREQRVLYANILEYEQDQCECDWPKVWKANLKKNPNDATLVSGLLAHLLSLKLSRSPGLAHSLSDASLSLSMLHDLNADDAPEMDSEQIQTPTPPDRENSFEDLEQFLTQMDWVPAPGGDDTDLEERALKEHLKAIVKDVMMPSVDRCCLFACSLLNVSNTASAKDQCVACIEEVFFMPIWSPLLALFRKVHRERELAFENSVHLYRNASPGDVGVAPKLFPKDMTLLHGSYPYECAVQELKQLCRDHCPQRKLECIVRTLRLICACAGALPPPTGQQASASDCSHVSPISNQLSARSGHPELADLLSRSACLERALTGTELSIRGGDLNNTEPIAFWL
uniref:VPS9 domain containing 1 n=1 Tax=Electrophorus electricus TaxID=8005 RepID=A0AAY5EH39_ELEEL